MFGVRSPLASNYLFAQRLIIIILQKLKILLWFLVSIILLNNFLFTSSIGGQKQFSNNKSDFIL